MARDIYAEVTAKILAELEAGAAPWVKRWSTTPGQNIPCNAVSNRPYSGMNVVLLWAAREAGYRTPRFLTFKQALELGGNVRKGEHGYPVTYFKQLRVMDKNAPAGEDDERTIPMMRLYTVFNVDQCENLPDRVLAPPAVRIRNPHARDLLADEFVAATGAEVREGFGEAYYRPGADFVSMPAFAAFHSADEFYSTLYHELGHWTGHPHRLARDLRGRFDQHAYAAEELVAELAAAFLCAEWNMDGDLRHASYIEGWISLLKSDKRAFATAASKAWQAADYLRGLALREPVPADRAAA